MLVDRHMPRTQSFMYHLNNLESLPDCVNTMSISSSTLRQNIVAEQSETYHNEQLNSHYSNNRTILTRYPCILPSMTTFTESVSTSDTATSDTTTSDITSTPKDCCDLCGGSDNCVLVKHEDDSLITCILCQELLNETDAQIVNEPEFMIVDKSIETYVMRQGDP